MKRFFKWLFGWISKIWRQKQREARDQIYDDVSEILKRKMELKDADRRQLVDDIKQHIRELRKGDASKHIPPKIDANDIYEAVITKFGDRLKDNRVHLSRKLRFELLKNAYA